MVEVLNTKAVGPRLSLAPDADPNDGFFEIVCIHNDDRVNFLQYVTGLLTQGFDKIPSVRRYTGKKLEFEWTGFPVHVDAEIYPWKNSQGEQSEQLEFDPEGDITVSIEVLPHALELWLPPGIS